MLAFTNNVTAIAKKLAERSLRSPSEDRLRAGRRRTGREPGLRSHAGYKVLVRGGATIYVDKLASELLADKVFDGSPGFRVSGTLSQSRT